jgi:hypothetical protein
MTTSSLSGSDPAVVDGVDVDAVAAAVRACMGVAGLDGGRFGEVASYLPGRKVPGVVVSDGRVMVRVRARWGIPAPDLAALITTALTPFTGGKPVDVVVGDIDDPPGRPQPGEPAGRHPSEPADWPGPAPASPAGTPESFPLPS